VLLAMQLRSFFGRKVAHLITPLSQRRSIEQLLGHIFINDKWLQIVPDFKIIGNLKSYLVIFVTNKADEEPGWFSEIFFESLRPHERDEGKDEVIFESGLVINVRDILEKPKASNIDVTRLTKRGLLGRHRTWYYSHTRSILKKATAKIMNDCIVIDVYLR